MSSKGYRAVLVFSKSAEHGKVKTRLKTALDENACMALHLALLKDTLATCTSLSGTEVVLYLSTTVPLPFDPRVPVKIQSEGDLGTKMKNAFESELQRYERVLIVGTDCPALTPGWIADAFSRLDSNDCVLGPSSDGGYYLIGLRTLLPETFSGIPWSTAGVLNATLAKVPDAALIAASYDIDEPADLQRMLAEIDAGELPQAKHVAAWALGR